MSEEAYADVNYKSICCEQIPDLFLDKLIAKKHFSKFGKISRFILRPKRLSCTVEYDNEIDAERALEEAGNYNGYEFPIRYADREVGHVQNTEEWVDADVQSELDAMGAAGANSNRPSNFNSVTKAMPALIAKASTWVKSAPKPVEEKPSPILTAKVDTTVRAELEAILRQPAYSNEEKYRVLDARDKLIRLKAVRQIDIAKTERRKGTCPDMCPEKERLMRDFQRQVAAFETTKSGVHGSISHRRAIKEYSRSSADQEVPLAHELRPESVLKMTMLYLMHRIMDQLDTTQVNVSDWFHFVWDRTRSIRKDITQQELCSLNAVELVEQCARFHIHCAARLVAEDPSVFDQKINAENLTKCLQTLKYLYHDLRLKNVRCPQEAEFRSYIVLLNLGNSNFLWEVKQLPEHIQKSHEIKRAMAFYNVLHNNNYVRFFNMVRETETSYLSACILLGYFTKLRLRAMEAIVKSHNWRKNSVFMPLYHLTRILGFEDEEAATHFFQYHGLICEGRGVLLDRPQPMVDYCMDRALKLVESKRTTSVGECICGHPLDSTEIFENHQPHNSFENNGILKLESWTAEDQLRGDDKLRNFQSQQQQPQQQQSQIKAPTPNQLVPATKPDNNIFKVPQISPKNQLAPKATAPTSGFSFFDNQSTESIPTNSFPSSNSIFKSVPEKTAVSGGNLFMTTPQHKDNNFGTSIFGDIAKPPPDSKILDIPREDTVFQYYRTTPPDFQTEFNKGITQQFPKVDEDELAKKKAAAEEVARKLAEAKQQLEAEMERKRKLEEAERQRKAAEKAAAEHAATARKLKLATIQHKSEHELETLLHSTLHERIADIVKRELQLFQSLEAHAVRVTDSFLKEFLREEIEEIAGGEYRINCHDRMLIERYFSIWLCTTRKKIEQRKLLDTTPIWATTETFEEQTAQLLHPSMDVNLRLIKRYRHGEPCDFSKLLGDGNSELRSYQPIDICKIVAKYIAHESPVLKIQQRNYFKLLFTLPADSDEFPGFGSLCSKWLQNSLRFPQTETDAQVYISDVRDNVALCVRKVCGTPPVNEHGQKANHSECDNLDGIVFFMTCADLANTRRRLHHLLQTSRNFKRLPVAFVVYGNYQYEETSLTKALDIESLLERRLLSAFKFYDCHGQKTEKTFKANLEHAVFFSIRTSIQHNASELSNLEMQSTQSLLETCLGEEMWHRWHASALQNPAFYKICSMLPHVVGLYNAAIERLRQMLSEPLGNAPEFPQELKQYVPKTSEANNMPQGLEYFPNDFKSPQRQKTLLDFLKQIELPAIEKQPPQDVNGLKAWLLEYAGLCITDVDDEKSTTAAYYAIKALIEQLTRADLQTLEIRERLKFISFLPVVKIFAFANINEQLQSFSGKSLPAETIYHKQSLASYIEYPWWLNYEAVEAVTVDYKLNSERQVQNPESNKNVADDIEAAIERAAEISQVFEQKTNGKKFKPTHTPETALIQQLDESIQNIESAKNAGIYAIPTQIRPHLAKRANKVKKPIESSSSVNKKLKSSPESMNDVSNVISKALALIDKVNATRDLEAKLDYVCSKLDF